MTQKSFTIKELKKIFDKYFYWGDVGEFYIKEFLNTLKRLEPQPKEKPKKEWKKRGYEKKWHRDFVLFEKELYGYVPSKKYIWRTIIWIEDLLEKQTKNKPNNRLDKQP